MLALPQRATPAPRPTGRGSEMTTMTGTAGPLSALMLAACAASAQPPQPSLPPVSTADDPETTPTPDAVVATPTTADSELRFEDRSRFERAGLAFGQTVPGSEVVLDGLAVPVDREGRFVLGFGQFADPTATLEVTYPDGTSMTREVAVADRAFEFGGVITVAPNKVNPYTDEDLAHIARSTALKNAARAAPSTEDALWAEGFEWPARGYVTSRFGKYRTYNNGERARPHSGVDVAAPRAPGGGPARDFTGTEVVAPSAGEVILAEPDMFFEGGLVLIDHGQNLESALLHLSQVDVKAGDIVARGERIGAAGSTGRSTGPHVHWSLKWHGRLVDPEMLVPPMDESGD